MSDGVPVSEAVPLMIMTCDEEGCTSSIHAPEGYPQLDEALLTGLARLEGWRTTAAGVRPSRHLCRAHNIEGQLTFDGGTAAAPNPQSSGAERNNQ